MLFRILSPSVLLVLSMLFELGALIAASNTSMGTHAVANFLHFIAQFALISVWHDHLMIKADQLDKEKQFLESLAVLLDFQKPITEGPSDVNELK